MREILFTITNNKERIEPRTRQWAGMQFEDNMTNIVFDLSILGHKNALYRIDFNSPGAGYQPSEALEITDGRISRTLPLSVTQYGGDIQVTAVVTVLDENGIETGVQLSYPVIVYLTAVNQDNNISIKENITAAEVSALEAAARAEKAANNAETYRNETEISADRTEAARRALEEDTVFVFNGGDASSQTEVDLVVDDYLSEISRNPIENSIVAKEFDSIKEQHSQDIAALQDDIENQNETLLKSIKEIKQDYVIETGFENGWRYRKWNSGLAEMWARMSIFPGEFTKDSYLNSYFVIKNLPFVVKRADFVAAHVNTHADTTLLPDVLVGARVYDNESEITISVNVLPDTSYLVSVSIVGTWK